LFLFFLKPTQSTRAPPCVFSIFDSKSFEMITTDNPAVSDTILVAVSTLAYWEPEEIKELVHQVLKHAPYKTIGKNMRRPPSWCRHRLFMYFDILDTLHVLTPGQWYRWGPKEVEELVHLVSQHAPWREIGKNLCRTPRSCKDGLFRHITSRRATLQKTWRAGPKLDISTRPANRPSQEGLRRGRISTQPATSSPKAPSPSAIQPAASQYQLPTFTPASLQDSNPIHGSFQPHPQPQNTISIYSIIHVSTSSEQRCPGRSYALAGGSHASLGPYGSWAWLMDEER